MLYYIATYNSISNYAEDNCLNASAEDFVSSLQRAKQISKCDFLANKFSEDAHDVISSITHEDLSFYEDEEKCVYIISNKHTHYFFQ